MLSERLDHFNKTLQQVIQTGEDFADGRVTEEVAAEASDVALSEVGVTSTDSMNFRVRLYTRPILALNLTTSSA